MNLYRYVTLYPDVPKHLRVTDVLMNKNWSVTHRSYQDRPPEGWDDEQLQQIGEWAGEISMGEMARRLGKTRWAVEAAMERVHPEKRALVGTKYKYTWRDKWKPGELQFIIDNYIDARCMRGWQLAEKFGVKERLIRKTIQNLRKEGI